MNGPIREGGRDETEEVRLCERTMRPPPLIERFLLRRVTVTGQDRYTDLTSLY